MSTVKPFSQKMLRLLLIALCFSLSESVLSRSRYANLHLLRRINELKRTSSVWRPSASTTFDWQLTGNINTNNPAHVYDVDLFLVPATTITYLHQQGKKVICYFSAGTFEHDGTGKTVRPDVVGFPNDVKGTTLIDWPHEQWLDIRRSEVKTIMTNRLKLARDKGCDAVEPDNVDGFANDNGFDLQADDQLKFNIWIAQEAHSYGLSVGLKNDMGQIEELEPYFDWALNEECVAFGECNDYQPFIQANKAVFHVEYVNNHSEGPSRKTAVCNSNSRPRQLITLIKDWDLSDWFLSC